jgi:hypothetical protein
MGGKHNWDTVEVEVAQGCIKDEFIFRYEQD